MLCMLPLTADSSSPDDSKKRKREDDEAAAAIAEAEADDMALQAAAAAQTGGLLQLKPEQLSPAKKKLAGVSIKQEQGVKPAAKQETNMVGTQQQAKQEHQDMLHANGLEGGGTLISEVSQPSSSELRPGSKLVAVKSEGVADDVVGGVKIKAMSRESSELAMDGITSDADAPQVKVSGA